MTKNDIIECKICKNSSCKNCFKRFVLDHEYESKCMHCKAKISRDFIIQKLALLVAVMKRTGIKSVQAVHCVGSCPGLLCDKSSRFWK